MKNDLGDVAEQVAEDKKFLADLEKNCATKEKEWAQIVETRNQELLALADTSSKHLAQGRREKAGSGIGCIPLSKSVSRVCSIKW
jgi:hypothetical protein